MPPTGRVAQGVDDALDVVGESAWNLFLVIASQGTDETQVATDILVQFLLADEPAQLTVKLGFVSGKLDVDNHMGLGLLMEEPVVAMPLYMPQLSPEGLALHMPRFYTLLLQTREQYQITLFNLLDFHNR